MKYLVTLTAVLPAHAKMYVEAESEEAASDYALNHSEEAGWDGADYSVPDAMGGIEVASIEVVKA